MASHAAISAICCLNWNHKWAIYVILLGIREVCINVWINSLYNNNKHMKINVLFVYMYNLADLHIAMLQI